MFWGPSSNAMQPQAPMNVAPRSLPNLLTNGPQAQAPGQVQPVVQTPNPTAQNPNPLVTGGMPSFLPQWAQNPYQQMQAVWQGLPHAPIQMPGWFQGGSPYSEQGLPTAPVPDAAAAQQQPVAQEQPQPAPAPAPMAAGKPLFFGHGTQQMYGSRPSAFHAEVHNNSRPEIGMDGRSIMTRNSGPPDITRINQALSPFGQSLQAWRDRRNA